MSPQNGTVLRILVRADGGVGYEVGMGHIVKTLALLEQLARLTPVHAVFVMKPNPPGNAKVREAGFQVLLLPGGLTPEEEGRWVCDAARDFKAQVIMTDRLDTSEDYMSALKTPGSILVTFDDLGPGTRCADMVFNGIAACKGRAPSPLSGEVYQGPEYERLRRQFQIAHSQSREIRPQPRELLVTTGGGDAVGATPRLVRLLLRSEFAGLKVHIVAGPAYWGLKALKRLTESAPGTFQVHVDVADMAALMRQVDLVITAGGSTLYELAATGTPALVLCAYAHQLPAASFFAKHGAALSLGMHSQVTDGQIGEALTQLLGDGLRRQAMSLAGKELVDGRGAERVAYTIASSVYSPQGSRLA